MLKFFYFYLFNIYNIYVYIILWNLWDYCCFQENFVIIYRLFNVIFFIVFDIVIRILSFKKGKKKR